MQSFKSERHRWFGTPRATLVLFASAAAFLAAVLSLTFATAYQDAQARAETRASAYSQVVSANIQWLAEASYQALRRIDNAVGDSLVLPTETALADLNAAVDSLPVNVEAWVFDVAGTPRLTTATTTQAVNASDREYFMKTRDGEPFFISSLITSRSSDQQVFVIAKRVERLGKFVGTATIVVPATYMDTFRRSLDLGSESTVGLIRADGMLVSRSPVPQIATDLSNYVLFTDYLKQSDEGTYTSKSPTDGVDRVVGYRRVPGYPLVAVASISLSEAFTGFWQTVTIIAAVTVPGLIGLSLFAYWTIRAQIELEASLERNQTLFREIHHRVKNNLQQVSALVQLQPLDDTSKADMARRISAMVAVHEHMYRSDSYDTISVDDYLPPLVEAVKASFAKPVTLISEIAPAIIDRDSALPLALICNEVIANAIKHGFPDGRAGRIQVKLEEIASQRAKLTIRDNGVGFDPAAVSRGMGSRLLKGLSAQLQSTSSVEIAQGTVFSIEFDVLGFAPLGKAKYLQGSS